MGYVQMSEPDYRANLMRIEVDLAKAKRQGFKKVQIHGGDASRCAACGKLNGKVIGVGSAATSVIPRDCARLGADKPICFLMLSAAIKRPDGTVYFERA